MEIRTFNPIYPTVKLIKLPKKSALSVKKDDNYNL